MTGVVTGVDLERSIVTLEVDGEVVELDLADVERAIHGEEGVQITQTGSGIGADGAIVLGAMTVAVAPFGLSKLIHKRRAAKSADGTD
jgi:hypothetical protein